MAETLERGSAVLTTTSPVDVYTVPSSSGSERALLVGLNVCNVSAAEADIILSVVNAAGATQARLAYKDVLLSRSRRQFIDGNGKLVLKSGERLRATASVGNALEVLASVVLEA